MIWAIGQFDRNCEQESTLADSSRAAGSGLGNFLGDT